MGPGMFDGFWRGIGCLILLAFLAGIAATSCIKACPYRVNVERRP